MKHRCRQVSGLLLQAQDRPLRWHERLQVRLHLALCDACTRFAGQLRVMRQAMRSWQTGGPPER